MKVLFTYDYGEDQMKRIEALGYEIKIIKEAEVTTDLLRSVSFSPEVLVCYDPFSNLDISKLEQLKWIQLSSIGVDQVPIDKVIKKQMIVTNNRGGYSIPMGEWIVHQMLSFYKQEHYFYKMQTQKSWCLNTSVRELTGKKVCFIGTGTIAQEAVKRLQGFDMNLIGINTNGRMIEGFDQCFPMSQVDEVISISDFIVIAIPHTAATTHLLNKERFKLMKNDAVLINVARGAVIKEEDLIEVLEQDKFLGVALDVFEQEPLAADHPLWGFDQVKVTPHNSWISQMRNVRRFDMIFKNLEAYIKKKPLENRVDLQRGY